MSALQIDPALPSCRTRIQEIGEAIDGDGLPTGGLAELYEPIGRHVFIKLIESGLLPESKVLDIGCGGLRCGYWLIHFLAPSSYYGIEPNERMLQAGLERLFDAGLLAEKSPRFDHNQAFDFSPFGERFDFVVARSIWSHASLRQIAFMLDQFVEHTSDEATFLTSYVPTREKDKEYTGDEFSWPAIRYRKETLEELIRAAGLRADFQDTVQLQRWVKITAHATSPSA